MRRSIFDKLLTLGLDPGSHELDTSFAVFDFESCLANCDITPPSQNFSYLELHQPICVSVCSNIAPFDKGEVFISTNSCTLVAKMMDFFDRVRTRMIEINYDKWGHLLTALSDMILSRGNDLKEREVARQAEHELNVSVDNVIRDTHLVDIGTPHPLKKNTPKGDAFYNMFV